MQLGCHFWQIAYVKRQMLIICDLCTRHAFYGYSHEVRNLPEVTSHLFFKLDGEFLNSKVGKVQLQNTTKMSSCVDYTNSHTQMLFPIKNSKLDKIYKIITIVFFISSSIMYLQKIISITLQILHRKYQSDNDNRLMLHVKYKNFTEFGTGIANSTYYILH